MTTLHFDCFSGISGDMTLGALVDLGLPLKDLARALKAMPVSGYDLGARKVRRGDMQATKVDIKIRKGLAAPVALRHIDEIIQKSRLPGPVKDRSHQAFELLGQAESRAHNVPPSRVHFHEVGAVDSLVDVIGSLLGCHLLGLEHFTASPVNLGSGFVKTAHGRLRVPGPAVAVLAESVPVYNDGPTRELTTPTGMALLRTLVSEYGSLPLMRLEGVGCGAGTDETPDWPNVLRVFRGAMASTTTQDRDRIVVLETNLDDLNPQAYEMVMERLFGIGALDVTLTPLIMKHGRPAVTLTALVPPEKAEAVTAAILRETTTLGVRMHEAARRILPRYFETVNVGGREVRMKLGTLPDGTQKAAPEYQDCKRIAEQTGRPIRDIMEEALLMFRMGRARKSR
jgi:uncharacterized protein (TIGR00299 family) protein